MWRRRIMQITVSIALCLWKVPERAADGPAVVRRPEPQAGRHGSSCDANPGSCMGGSVCKEGTCLCVNGTRPNQEFICESLVADKGSTSNGNVGLVMGVIAVCLLLGAALTALALRRQNLKTQKHGEVLTNRTVSLNELMELSQGVEEEAIQNTTVITTTTSSDIDTASTDQTVTAHDGDETSSLSDRTTE